MTKDKYIGQVYGELTVIDIVGKKPTGRKVYLFACSCGDTRESIIGNVVHGTIKSCMSCTQQRVAEHNKVKNLKHGWYYTGLYQSWKCMKSRCKDTTSPHYGKLDIWYTDEWEKFEGFKDWALQNGWEEGLVIDRIDPSKGYYPNNCRWLTRIDNCARAMKGKTPWNKK
jgi:hypothetical protein